MGVLSAAAFLAARLPVQEDEVPLGPKTVNVRNASFYGTPSRLKGEPLRPAKYGEPVTVTAIQGSYAKVVLNDGPEAYIPRSALIARDKFQFEAADEAELAKLKADKYASSRFDPETEKKYGEQKGPAIQAAYKQVDVLEARSIGRDRAGLERLLAGFRRGGKLGEFANVK